jgi:hypothetical protein
MRADKTRFFQVVTATNEAKESRNMAKKSEESKTY